jgi:uncharacterized protein (TIGR02246 family)
MNLSAGGRKILRAIILTSALFAATIAHAAPAGLTEAEVRAFVARQETAWNAGDLAGFFGLATPDASYTDQARAKDGRVVPYGTSNLAQARAQARRFFARSRTRETVVVRAVRIAPDGRSARVEAQEDATIASSGRTRHICAETVQTVVLTPAGLRSRGQTDTLAPCR